MNAPAMKEAASKQGIVLWAAQEYGIEAGKVLSVLKTTCFRPGKKDGKLEEPPTDPEVAALMIVARAHGLNPFLRQIYAFKDKRGGIVPVVGVDGWAQLINDNEHFDGVEFEYGYEDEAKKKLASITAIIYHKKRSRPTRITEFMDECRRNTEPWNQSPRRMLRHKALIQCARVAFSFSGIYDDDEASRIIDGTATEVPTLQVGELVQRDVDEEPNSGSTGSVKPSATATLASELAAAAKPEPGTSATVVWKTPSEIRALLAAAGGIEDLNAILAFISPLPDTPERTQLMREWNDCVLKVKGFPPAEAQPKSAADLVDGPGES